MTSWHLHVEAAGLGISVVLRRRRTNVHKRGFDASRKSCKLSLTFQFLLTPLHNHQLFIQEPFYRHSNSVLFGCPPKHIARLQRAQHALARVVTQHSSRSTSHTSTDLLRQLHWLRVEWRIRFKLASLTLKVLHTGHPPYPADLYMQCHKPTRTTRSFASHLLSISRHSLWFVLVLFQFLHRKYEILYLLTFCSLKHSLHLDVIQIPTTFSQPILPLAPIPMSPDSLLKFDYI